MASMTLLLYNSLISTHRENNRHSLYISIMRISREYFARKIREFGGKGTHAKGRSARDFMPMNAAKRRETRMNER